MNLHCINLLLIAQLYWPAGSAILVLPQVVCNLGYPAAAGTEVNSLTSLKRNFIMYSTALQEQK
jgi:hypothetical protein